MSGESKDDVEAEVFTYNSNDIRIYRTPDEIWFQGKNITYILEYKDSRDVLRRLVSRKYKKQLKKIFPNFNFQYSKGETNYINKCGLVELLCKCRMTNKFEFIEFCNKNFELNIENHSFLSKENDIIGAIIKTFGNEKYETQFLVGKYKIDLYFTEKKIAIECDEYNHKGRNKNYEANRQKYIENKLGCKFIRFDPDDGNFDIFLLIKKIILEMREPGFDEELFFAWFDKNYEESEEDCYITIKEIYEAFKGSETYNNLKFKEKLCYTRTRMIYFFKDTMKAKVVKLTEGSVLFGYV
jgi:very-short-patch-repair endonuclease